MPNLPYIVYGTITDSDSTNPSGAKIVLRNDRSGQKISTVTNSSGQYLLDAANLTSGYVESDRLTSICAFGDADGESNFLISDNLGGKNANVTLVVIAESSDLFYCQVQDVLDELSDKTTTDISYNRVRKSILRAEKEIDEKTNTKFTATLVTDEIYDLDQYSSYQSPQQKMSFSTDVLYGTRNDHWNTQLNDRFRLEKAPLINPFTQLNGATTTTADSLTVDSTTDFPSSGTIFIYNTTNDSEQINYTGKTSTTFTGCTRSANSTTATAHANNSYVTMLRISRNQQAGSNADDWEDLEPQRGGGGDYIVNNNIGIVTVMDKHPSTGFRKVKASYTYGLITVPKTVERLAILLSVRDILISKTTGSQFDSQDNISLEGISITKGTSSSITYLNSINEEIKMLWSVVGNMGGLAV